VSEKNHKEARQQGMARQRSRPQRTVDIKVLVAAWARGWSLEQIAFAASVSHQRVSQRIIRYEDQHGPIERDRRLGWSWGVKVCWRCRHCATGYWSITSDLRRDDGDMFCSMRCQVEHTRTITDEIIERAIDLRWAGKSWTSIAIELDHPQQSIQARIWKYLYLIGMLDRQTAESIWRTKIDGKRAAWNWLERGTGLICTEDGARLADKTYRHGHAWGQSLKRIRIGT
jgi:hypothetical protein